MRLVIMKKREVGEKRPLSPGLISNPPSNQAKRDEIEKQTAEFIAKKGKVQEVEFGVMKADTKGITALCINHEQVADGFKTK